MNVDDLWVHTESRSFRYNLFTSINMWIFRNEIVNESAWVYISTGGLEPVSIIKGFQDDYGNFVSDK